MFDRVLNTCVITAITILDFPANFLGLLVARYSHDNQYQYKISKFGFAFRNPWALPSTPLQLKNEKDL